MENSVVTPEDNQEDASEVEIFNMRSEIELFKSKKQEFRCRPIRLLLQSIPYQVCVTALTIFALFADDVNTLAFGPEADFTFDVLQLVIMCFFFLEIILSSFAINDYVFSFFFWLDILSTLSILMDVNLFTDIVFNSSNTTNSGSISKIASQSKASRAAARAVRIIRLIRLLRVVKLYKSAVKANEIKELMRREKLKHQKQKSSSEKISTKGHVGAHDSHEVVLDRADHETKSRSHYDPQKIDLENSGRRDPAPKMIVDSEDIAEMENKESKVSQILSNANIQKVILVVLLIMFFVPLFDATTYVDDNGNLDFFLQNMEQLLYNTKAHLVDIIAMANCAIEEQKTYDPPLIAFCTPFEQFPCFGQEEVLRYRNDDTLGSSNDIDVQDIMKKRPTLTLNPNNQSSSSIVAVTNKQNLSKINAYFSIGRIIFVCLVLATLLHFFTKDTDTLIIQPIQSMIQKVREMALNPTAVGQDLLQQTQYETAIIHNAILKIGNMLSLVYGNAGAQIIGTNMMKGGDMNPLTGGKKMAAIFGFCDIRNFTDATEVLQENIMIFVNQIGEIVHSSVYRYGGSANKNIGDAFLLVWKIPKDKYEIEPATNSIKWNDQRFVSVLSDFSLLSFIKIIVKINKQPKILKYRHDQKLLSRLGPNYQVRMGFGLHIGWAIQGAIGSQYKIDASYLSPNVNMASRLQAATKQYGVPILISEAIYYHLTSQMKQFVRNIDRVTVKGSNQPIGLYTVDLDINNISPPMDKTKKYDGVDKIQRDVDDKRDENMYYLEEEGPHYQAYIFIEKKKELREAMMVLLELQGFRAEFQSGFESYIAGDWAKAISYLQVALSLKPEDGPTVRLLEYMNENIVDGKAPSTWKNYRELTEK